MARNRIIKPEFWADAKVGRLSFGARLLYIAMWNFADDYGIISASPRVFAETFFEMIIRRAWRLAGLTRPARRSIRPAAAKC